MNRSESISEKYTVGTYICMVLMLVADQLFSPFFESTTVIRIIELAFLFGIFYCLVKLLLDKDLVMPSGYFLVIYILLCLIDLGILIRGRFDSGIKDLILGKLLSPSSVPAYIVPLFILILPNRKHMLSILNVLFYSTLLIVPIWLIGTSDLVQDDFKGEAVGNYLPVFCIILILFRSKFPARRRLIIYAVFFIYLVFMILNARRNMMLSLTLYFIPAFIFGDYNSILRNKYILSGLVVGGIVASLLCIANWQVLSDGLFRRVLSRGTEDTRSEVETLFFVDMASSSPKDWILGRGLDGTYLQMTEDKDTNEFSMDRGVIETGYLYLILKGGVAYLLIILMFLFGAVFRAFRQHKHILTGIGLILLFYLIDMYVANPVSNFSTKSIMFWLFVSLVMSVQSAKTQRR